MTKKAVLYARVNGSDRKNEDRNLESQLEMCRTYAVDKGWTIVAELAEEGGGGGASYDLPQLNQALELARTGSYDFLVVRTIDRLSRDRRKLAMIEGELKRYGVKVVCVWGEYPEFPEGYLHKAIKAIIARHERIKITERMVQGRRHKVKRGSIIAHGKAPIGYDLVHDSDKYNLVINEQRAAVVRLIFKWYAQGKGQILVGGLQNLLPLMIKI